MKCSGMEIFKGRMIHAQQYRDYVGFENKDVFIIGIGNSSMDIAVELAKVSKSVCFSTILVIQKTLIFCFSCNFKQDSGKIKSLDFLKFLAFLQRCAIFPLIKIKEHPKRAKLI